MVSLSPISRKGGVPNEKSIRNSIDWTVASLADHAGVEDLSPYMTEVEKVKVSGVQYATQITSNNPLFGNPHNFIGIIGYAHPYWVFMFYNDKAKNSADLTEMKKILKSMSLSPPNK